jgi:hypothetical protein
MLAIKTWNKQLLKKKSVYSLSLFPRGLREFSGVGPGPWAGCGYWNRSSPSSGDPLSPLIHPLIRAVPRLDSHRPTNSCCVAFLSKFLHCDGNDDIVTSSGVRG